MTPTSTLVADLFCGAQNLCLAQKRIGVVRYHCQEAKGHGHGHTDKKACSWYDDGGTWLSHEEITRRWPRLLAAMQWALIGTHSEACDAISGLLTPYAGGSEAVMHFGGSKKVLATAIHARHSLRRFQDTILHRYTTKGAAR